MLRTSLILGLAACLISCASHTEAPPEATNSKETVILGPQRIDVARASASQCPNGGSVYTLFNDQNSNGVLEPSDIIINANVVCNGINGANGNNGSNGYSMVFATAAASLQECPAGGRTIVMALDIDGSNSISAADQNLQSLTVCNGQSGETPDYAPVAPILACGNTSPYKEVLLRLSNGQVLGSFSNNTGGAMTRLAFLPDGTFMNTDDSGCVFSLSTSPDGGTRSISWSGAVQMSWALK